MNDSALLRRLRAKDPSALEYLMDKYIPYLSAISWNLLRASMTREDAEEVVSDVFLAAWNQAGEIHPQAEGEWTFTFTLPDTDPLTQEVEMLTSSVRCTARRLMVQHNFDIAVQVTSFRLRPLTATLVYEEPLTGFWDGIILDPIYIWLKDGSRVLARYAGGSYQDGVCVSNLQFEVPISFADVDYIEFGGGDRAYMPE